MMMHHVDIDTLSWAPHQVTVLFKCRGDTKHAMAYRLARLSAQMVLACLAGIGASLVPGAAGALALVTSALGVQLLVFLWITCLCPSIDRIDNAVQVQSRESTR